MFRYCYGTRGERGCRVQSAMTREHDLRRQRSGAAGHRDEMPQHVSRAPMALMGATCAMAGRTVVAFRAVWIEKHLATGSFPGERRRHLCDERQRDHADRDRPEQAAHGGMLYR